jgi:hypothetical protein
MSTSEILVGEENFGGIGQPICLLYGDIQKTAQPKLLNGYKHGQDPKTDINNLSSKRL